MVGVWRLTAITILSKALRKNYASRGLMRMKFLKKLRRLWEMKIFVIFWAAGWS